MGDCSWSVNVDSQLWLLQYILIQGIKSWQAWVTGDGGESWTLINNSKQVAKIWRAGNMVQQQAVNVSQKCCIKITWSSNGWCWERMNSAFISWPPTKRPANLEHDLMLFQAVHSKTTCSSCLGWAEHQQGNTNQSNLNMFGMSLVSSLQPVNIFCTLFTLMWAGIHCKLPMISLRSNVHIHTIAYMRFSY